MPYWFLNIYDIKVCGVIAELFSWILSQIMDNIISILSALSLIWFEAELIHFNVAKLAF